MQKPLTDTEDQIPLSETRLSKANPFSIESIISSNKTPNGGIISSSRNFPHFNNIGSSTSPMSLPPNFSAVAASAASIYNPWIHNYLVQQKISENYIDLSAIAATSTMVPAISKEKLSEIFLNNATVTDPRSILAVDSDRHEKLLDQYFGNNVRDPKINGMFSMSSDYYKNCNNYGNLFVHYSDEIDYFREQAMLNFNNCKINNKTNAPNLGSESSNNSVQENTGVVPEDSGAEDTLDNELESDCSSEISLNMSAEVDNLMQGLSSFITFSHYLKSGEALNIFVSELHQLLNRFCN